MTTIDTDTPRTLSTVDEERAARLDAAGRAWSDRIDADRDSARLTYRVEGEARGSVATRIRAGRHTFDIDEPPALAGKDAAASPVEYALAALIGCQVVMYRLYAQTLGIPVDGIHITADGDLDVARLLGKDLTVRPGFSGVRLNVELTGPATAEQYRRLGAAVDAGCPVSDIFAHPTPVAVTVVPA